MLFLSSPMLLNLKEINFSYEEIIFVIYIKRISVRGRGGYLLGNFGNAVQNPLFWFLLDYIPFWDLVQLHF